LVDEKTIFDSATQWTIKDKLINWWQLQINLWMWKIITSNVK
jgi:hypothetical protein